MYLGIAWFILAEDSGNPEPLELRHQDQPANVDAVIRRKGTIKRGHLVRTSVSDTI